MQGLIFDIIKITVSSVGTTSGSWKLHTESGGIRSYKRRVAECGVRATRPLLRNSCSAAVLSPQVYPEASP